MTREMNKPDWHEVWKDAHEFKMDKIKITEYKKTRVLDEWIKPFFERCCNMERLK